LSGIGALTPGQTHLGQILLSLRCSLFLGTLQHVDLADSAVLQRVNVREKIELLKHHPEVAADAVEVAVGISDLLAHHHNLPRGGFLQQVHTAQQR
jgi:hypothetical protein